ncbi:MAG: AAA family ATPase [Elusimicrobiales bacterium]
MNFSTIKGHRRNINFLLKLLEGQRFFHSYLFSGVEGCGKKLVALAFARRILCIDKMSDECDCESCRMFRKNVHPDFRLVDYAFQSSLLGEDVEEQKSIKISTIREIIRFSSMNPSVSGKKVIIIDDAHKMVVEAQNALLKTLEEPGQTSIFILISPSPGLLLPTVVSRCHTINFAALSEKDVEEILIEKGFEPVMARQCSESSGGSVMLALKHMEIFRTIKEFSNLGPIAPFAITAKIIKMAIPQEAVRWLIDVVDSRINKIIYSDIPAEMREKGIRIVKDNMKYRNFLRHNVNARIISFLVLQRYLSFRKEISAFVK